MLKWLCVLLAATCVVLAVCLYSSQQAVRQLTREKQDLTTALAAARQQQAQTREKSAILVQEVETLRQQLKQDPTGIAATTLSAPLATEPAKPAGEAAGTSQTDGKSTDFFGKIGEMMKKPEMQEAMRAQQKAMLGMMYGALFKKLNLSPEALDKFKDALVNGQMSGLSAFGGGDQKTAMADIAEAQKQTEQAVKELLDEEQFKTYQDYQATLGERMALNQLNQQLTEKSMALDDAQQEELVTLMLEERQKLNIGSFPEQQQQALANGMPTSEMMEKLMQQQEELQKRILARAGEILTEAQKQELQAFQENQAKIQQLGLQFMKSMAGDENK